MTCIITDDEQNSRETLRHLLAAIAPDVVILAEAKNTEQTKRFVEKLKPDILFLDIKIYRFSSIYSKTHKKLIDIDIWFIDWYRLIFIYNFFKYTKMSKKPKKDEKDKGKGKA